MVLIQQLLAKKNHLGFCHKYEPRIDHTLSSGHRNLQIVLPSCRELRTSEGQKACCVVLCLLTLCYYSWLSLELER